MPILNRFLLVLRLRVHQRLPPSTRFQPTTTSTQKTMPLIPTLSLILLRLVLLKENQGVAIWAAIQVMLRHLRDGVAICRTMPSTHPLPPDR